MSWMLGSACGEHCLFHPGTRIGLALRSAFLAFGVVASVLLAAHAAWAQTDQLDFAGSVTWLGQVPIMVAVDKGFFKKEGLNVSFQTILSSSDRMAAVASGSAAFSNLGRGTVIAQIAHGNNSFYFFGNIDQSPGNEGCYARPGITTLADLKGKKVAANTSSEVTMDELLQTVGLSNKDVQLLDIPPNEMVIALLKGDVDAICVWKPFLDNAVTSVPGGKVLGTDADTAAYKKFGATASADVLIISRKLVAQHPDEARRLATAIFMGVDFANAHPAETAETVAHYFKKSPAEIEAGMKTFHYIGLDNLSEHMAQQKAHMQEIAQWLLDNHKISHLPDIGKWENISFVPVQ